MVIFIEMGRDEGRAKRMRDLIELDFLEVLETLEKKGGLKQEIMVRDFYEKFIEEESVEEGRTLMKKEGEEKILL